MFQKSLGVSRAARTGLTINRKIEFKSEFNRGLIFTYIYIKSGTMSLVKLGLAVTRSLLALQVASTS